MVSRRIYRIGETVFAYLSDWLHHVYLWFEDARTQADKKAVRGE